MHAVHDRWLETGENTCPVLDIIDKKLCPEGFRNSELIQDLGKLHIQRHGGATEWQVGKQEITLLYGNGKARTRLRTEVRVISAQDGAT